MFSRHDRVAFLLELPGDDRFERLRFDPEQLQRGAERGGVDRQLVALGQLLHRHRAKLHAVGGLPRRDFLVVVDGAGAGLQQMQVAIHRVLIERNEDVDLVTHVAHGRIARANGQERVPAADDRLVGVVSIEMEPAPREDAGENVPGGGDALAVLAANADRKIYFEICHLFCGLCTLLDGAGFGKLSHRQCVFVDLEFNRTLDPVMQEGMSPITGGCYCGKVRLRASGPILHQAYCHCANCRRAVGAQAVAWITVKLSEFAWEKGQPKRYQTDTGAYRTFCDSCGTSLTYENDERPNEIDITTGSLDEPENFPPNRDVFAEEKLSWVDLIDGS